MNSLSKQLGSLSQYVSGMTKRMLRQDVLYQAVARVLSELSQAGQAQAVTSSGTAVTLDWSNGRFWDVTLTGNCTITVPDVGALGEFYIRLTQDAVGGRTVAWNGNIDWPGGVAPVITNGAGKSDVVRLLDYGGSRYAGSVVQNY